jgi:acyl-CoA synthetase (NDP forming)
VDIEKRIAATLAAGKTALNETDAKTILAHYGVPVIEDIVVTTSAAAISSARQLGFPVVLKGMKENILHKTERGLVHLHLNDDAAVEAAAEHILTAAEGMQILIQPQVMGHREFMAGMVRDPQFGPAILFGIGGILTEALSDVVFRLAPLTRQDAEDMIAAIRARSLLDAFRGERAIDREQLVRTLMGLSDIAMEAPGIAEIDINPLVADGHGSLTAVDALITLAHVVDQAPEPPPVPPPAIHQLFYPRSVAFIGASSQMGKWGHMLICNTLSGGFAGEVYPVNPKGGIIAGRQAYRSVSEIPGDVDLAVVTIPAAAVIEMLPELSAKGIRGMALITSGFGETGADGKRLEQTLVDAARDAGVYILGPNTMGICNPHINFFCTGAIVRPQAGSTAVVAQSGNMGTQLLAFAEKQGIGIRAFSGSGNEAMLTIEDYMEAFDVDERTRTVMLYIESVKNGRRFFEIARRVSRNKPIVLLKGGQTTVGNRAATSHTGAMASDNRLFDAACRQAGIVKVDKPMELLDLAAAFTSLPLPQGNRVGIMTLGGGWGVVTADLCSRYHLEVPDLSPELVDRIDTILPPYWSRTNPIDLVGENDLGIPLSVMEALLAWDGCDAVINLGIFGRRILIKWLAEAVKKADPAYSDDFLDDAKRLYRDFEKRYIREIVRLMETYHKPVFGVSMITEEGDSTVYRVNGHDFKGIFFETPERAVKAAAYMVDYQRFRIRETA